MLTLKRAGRIKKKLAVLASFQQTLACVSRASLTKGRQTLTASESHGEPKFENELRTV